MKEILWCETHDHEKPYKKPAEPCRLVPMLLVPPGSLAISKENGEWPIPYVQLGLTAPVWSDDAVGIITHYLDALADRVGPREP